MPSARQSSKKTNRTEYLAPIFIAVAIADFLLGGHVTVWVQSGLGIIFLVGGAGLSLVTGLASVVHSVRKKSFNAMVLVNMLCVIYALDMLWAVSHLRNIWFLPAN